MKTARGQEPFWKRHLPKILGLALLALTVHDVFGEHGYLAMRRTQRQVEQLQGEIERLKGENQQLAEHVQALKSDPQTIEKIAREEMGLAKPGEMIFKMPAAPGGAGEPAAQPSAPPTTR